MKKQLTNYRINSTDQEALPSDAKLERMVLGVLLDVPSLIDQLMKYLQLEGIFYNDTHNKIWEAIQSVIQSRMEPNAKNVEGYFTRKGDRDTAVSVAAMTIYAGEITNMKQYCLKLFEIAVLRNIIRIGWQLNYKGYEREDAIGLLADASDGIGKLYEAIAGMKSKSLADGVNELTTELAEIAASPDGMLGIKGSLPFLNRILKGYRRGNMIVVGASSGEGKTTFMLQEISHIVRSGKPVGVVSLEMTQSELLLKIACELLNIPVDLALDGNLGENDMMRLGRKLDEIGRWPLHISETPALRISEVKATARMWKNRNKIGMLFIDHMHLVNSDFQHGNAEQKFTDIANQIKELSKELDMPVMALAQLARKETSEKRMHQMTDLKYAGGIEQAADVVIMIFRPEHHGIETTSGGESTEGKAVVKVEKLRLLKPGSVKCIFDGLRFKQDDMVNNLPGSWKPVKLNPSEFTEDPF